MASKTWAITKDAFDDVGIGWVGSGSNPNVIYLITGLVSGQVYRSFAQYSLNWAGVVQITDAVLHIRAYGGDANRRSLIRRCTASWSEASGPAPSTTATGEADTGLIGAGDGWKTVSIRTIVEAWAPSSVKDHLGNPGGGASNYGIRIAGYDEVTASRAATYYSRETAYDSYIVLTYSSDTAPNAPSSLSPTGGAVTTPTPTIAFTHTDPESDPLSTYDLQVSTDSTFASVTHWNIAAQTTGISGNNVSRVYAGTALTRGTTYYWRARTTESGGGTLTGPWCAAQSFKVNSLPTAALFYPPATGQLGKLVYTPGAGWASPRLHVAWNFSDADAGHAQTAYQVFVKNDADGSTFYDSGKVVANGNSLYVPATFVEGNKYRVKVQVWDTLDETGGYSTEFTIRTRWGFSTHRFDLTTAPTLWSVSTIDTTIGANSAVALEYGSDAAANSTPSSGWLATLAEAALARYFFYRVYLLAWGASPATSPTLNKLVLSYSANVLALDDWTLVGGGSNVDISTKVYGTQSLKVVSDAATIRFARQIVPVLPNTNYVLSWRNKQSGDARSFVETWGGGGAPGLTNWYQDAAHTTYDWTAYSLSFNSGALTTVQVLFGVYSNGTSGAVGWFDAVKLEASTVVTPWTPGFVSDAVVLDAGGISVDGTGGGVFRLQGSGGGSNDVVSLGAHGLILGSVGRSSGGAFPTSPAVAELFFRTDLGLEFYHDGVRWLSTQLFSAPLAVDNTLAPFSVNGTPLRGSVPSYGVGSDRWVVAVYSASYVVTTNNATNYWGVALVKNPAATNVATWNTSADAADGWRNHVTAVGALLGTNYELDLTLTKTLTPGTIYIVASMSYRIVAT